MRRREVIGLLGGTLVWPLSGSAELSERTRPAQLVRSFGEGLLDAQWNSAAFRQAATEVSGLRRISIFFSLAEGDEEGEVRLRIFRDRLQELGWTSAQAEIATIYTGADEDRIRDAAKEIVGSSPDLILAPNTLVLLNLLQETRKIPIIFVNVGDPVATGAVATLARPGGNATGFTLFEATMGMKWLDLLRELQPGLRSVGVLFNPATRVPAQYLRSVEAGAVLSHVGLVPWPVGNPDQIRQALFSAEDQQGVIVLPDPFSVTYRKVIVRLINERKLPGIYAFRQFASEGGLICYGVDLNDQYRQAASYCDRILRGAKPGDLPVQAPTKFELVINLKTATALGIEVPPTLLLAADEVIE